MKLLNRIPKLEQIVPVYAVTVTMIYTWSLILFFWRLPSFLYYSTVGEIAVIFSYMVVVNLIESLLVILIPVALAFFLPQKLFYNKFVTMGSTVVMLSLGYLMLFYQNLIGEVFSLPKLLQNALIIGLIILALSFLIDRIGFLKKIIGEFSNLVIIFLYIWGAVSVFAFLNVLVRNIF